MVWRCANPEKLENAASGTEYMRGCFAAKSDGYHNSSASFHVNTCPSLGNWEVSKSTAALMLFDGPVNPLGAAILKFSTGLLTVPDCSTRDSSSGSSSSVV